jgi:hypothetical protein
MSKTTMGNEHTNTVKQQVNDHLEINIPSTNESTIIGATHADNKSHTYITYQNQIL